MHGFLLLRLPRSWSYLTQTGRLASRVVGPDLARLIPPPPRPKGTQWRRSVCWHRHWWATTTRRLHAKGLSSPYRGPSRSLVVLKGHAPTAFFPRQPCGCTHWRRAGSECRLRKRAVIIMKTRRRVTPSLKGGGRGTKYHARHQHAASPRPAAYDPHLDPLHHEMVRPYAQNRSTQSNCTKSKCRSSDQRPP